MSYRLGEPDQSYAIMAQVVMGMLMEGNRSRIVCEKRVAYLELLSYLVFGAKY
jgi:hypothetical protein